VIYKLYEEVFSGKDKEIISGKGSLVKLSVPNLPKHYQKFHTTIYSDFILFIQIKIKHIITATNIKNGTVFTITS